MFRALARTAAQARPARLSAAPLSVVHARGYHENVIRHYENPRNVGSLPKDDVDVGTGLVGAPACGDVMKLQIRVDENGIIQEAKFKTFGCGSAIASSSYMTELVTGRSLEEASKIKNTEIAKELCLPPLSFIVPCSRKMPFAPPSVIIAPSAAVSANLRPQPLQVPLLPCPQLRKTVLGLAEFSRIFHLASIIGSD
ncbi:NifU-like N terminal domain-containing protein [Auriculariales sp. MPI-PUGE-AT-0066]|nr:NifU-like N terminal domain-containing protein [Auriculariales sp. MPI-PUGE-AT-0066]